MSEWVIEVFVEVLKDFVVCGCICCVWAVVCVVLVRVGEILVVVSSS